jgi:hypothetical protein
LDCFGFITRFWFEQLRKNQVDNNAKNTQDKKEKGIMNKCTHLKAESPKSFLGELGLEETQFKVEFSPSLTRRRQQIVANYLVKYRGGRDIVAQKRYVYENRVLCSS